MQIRFGFGKPIKLLSFGYNNTEIGAPERYANTLFLNTNLKTYLLFLSRAIDYNKNQEIGLGMNFKT